MRALGRAFFLLLAVGAAALSLGAFAALGGSGPLWLRTLGTPALALPPGGFFWALALALLAALALTWGLLGRGWRRR